MKDFELKDTDPEDLEDLLLKVEKSYGIEFSDGELQHVQTFGELCDYIINKISLDRTDSCTTQQAFYKFRAAIEAALAVDKEKIAPDTLLADILPKKERKSKLNDIERILGFNLELVGPPDYLIIFLIIVLLGSVICLFFNLPLGITGLAVSILGFNVSYRFGNKLKIKTIGQVAEKMARENYLKSRRDPSTINEKEIASLLTDWFSEKLYLDKEKLTRAARLA